MRNKTRRETSFFNNKREKQGNTGKNRGQNTKKLWKTGEKNPGKLQKIKKQDFDKISENAENGKEILTRFHKMLKRKREQKQGLL